MKILVPLDGSRLADGILAHVRRLVAEAPGAEVTLLQALPAYLSDDEVALRRHEADEHHAALRKLLAHEGVAVRSRVVVAADPAECVVDAARDLGADLIALSTHGRSGPSRWLRGSVAERVLRGATVPVYTANPQGLVMTDDAIVGWRRVLVPLDGSERATRVLALAGRFALSSDAEVVLLHVDEPEVPGVHPVPEVAARKAQERAEAALAEAKERLGRAGLQRVRVIGRYGADPAAEVLEAAREVDADLIAIASHGRTGLARWRFGSVAEKVLRAAEAPLLIVRAV
ncbi:MAG: universal stress protein [Planctomycetota bacterium]|nr:universal stress protein [Planctomycetota bacterium]